MANPFSPFLKVILLMAFSLPSFGQPFSFQKIKSGTKADIRAILADNQEGIYFLTDKMYRQDQDAWKKLDFPVEGKIYYFYSVSAQDIWFNVNQNTSNCLLYHYCHGVTVSIRPPLANSITSIYFISENKALFAGLGDIAVYDNGSFRMLPPVPGRSSTVKIFAEDLSAFWALTGGGELFLYEHGIYTKVFGGKMVTDFCFTDLRHGYLLSGEELFLVEGQEVRRIYNNADFLQVKKMRLLENGTLILVGTRGVILSFKDGRLLHHNMPDSENFTDLVITKSDDIWICGENGRILYSGSKRMPEYIEDNQGFASHKLILYGINTDDEYGVAMTDFNGDDKTDIYAVRIYEQNRLYINNLTRGALGQGANGFTEEAVKRNAIGTISSASSSTLNELKLGIGAVDIDNDHDQDIYLCYLNSNNRLLLNRGNGYFRNVSEQQNRACENMKRSNAAVFADVDTDGDLDLFVTNEEGSNRLFENNGTGHFTDITSTSGLGSAGGGMCASFADVNNDGYPDLCVSFWYPSNRLYINESKKGVIHFRDVTRLTDLAKSSPSKSNAVSFADINNDGFIDLYIANRNTGSKLYLNNGKGIFRDKTTDYFKPETNMSNGAVFADFDLDGYLDLYVTNVGENVLYKNMEGRCFRDVTAAFGAELSGYCTGCAVGDVDQDGDPDLYVANYINGNSNLFLNVTERRTYLKFKLHGVRSNDDAIGAKIWLYRVSDDRTRGIPAGYQEMNGGSGYASISAKELIFGVEAGEEYYAQVKFPSSPDTLRLDHLIAPKTIEINEMIGIRALYTETAISILSFFRDQENQPEIIKYVSIFLILVLYNLKLRKNNRNIVLIRWMTTCFIFVVFIVVNRIFLFSWLSVSYFIAPVIVLGLLAIEYLFIDRILLRRMAQKETLDLREKLSRDLHDELASTLGSISIYAETLKGLTVPLQVDLRNLPIKIAGLTQSALQSVSEIIWMTSPRNDTLQSVISKTSNYMLEITTDNNIIFSSSIDIPEEPVILQEQVRNDIFLILKEGLHNIIRHAGASHVSFVSSLKDSQCSISLKDDGKGMAGSMAVKKGFHGNGLVNMRRRAQESGIEFSILSAEGAGTEIVMYFKI